MPLLSAGLLAGCGGGGSSGSGSTAAPITTTLGFRRLERGASTSLVTTATDLRTVTSTSALASLWTTHAPGAQPPAVDFAAEQVGALFLGERPTDGFGIDVVGVAEVTSGGATTFEVSYQRTSPSGATTAGRTAPFDVVAVNRPASAGRLTFKDVTVGSSRALAQVHGELVSVPAISGGAPVLAFLEDGASAPLEVLDLAPFTAAKLHEGFTLVLDGAAETNRAGATALAEGLRATRLQADDVWIGGAVGAGSLTVDDQDARAWTPTGPLAQALLATPVGRPVLVFGRRDPTSLVLRNVEVTAWRPVVRVGWTDVRPLLGQTTFDVFDLDATCAYHLASTDAGRGNFTESRGRGLRLGAGLASDLRARVAAANLRALPQVFQPPQLYPDHPLQVVRLDDAQGHVDVTVYAGAMVPPELDALLTAFGALPPTIPSMRSIDQGTTSQITTAGAETCRDLQSWGSLIARHVGGRPVVPQVDFPREVGVGVFDGARPSSGFTVEVTDALKIGPNLHLLVLHAPPPGRPVATPTAPYHLVAVDLTGSAELWIEGVRQP